MTTKKYLDTMLDLVESNPRIDIIEDCIRETKEVLEEAKETVVDADLALVRLYHKRNMIDRVQAAKAMDKTEEE